MNEFIENNLEHVLCVLLLISRLGDIISTYLVSPKLKLEANPIAKRLGWRFCLLTVLVCLLPYYDTDIAIVVLVPSLLASSANIGKFWIVRTMGEDEYYRRLLEFARKSKLSQALFSVFMSSFFIILAGLVLLVLCSYPEGDSGYWFGIGMILFGFIVMLYGSNFFRVLFKKAQQSNGSKT